MTDSKRQFWISIENETPTLNDFDKARCDLYNMGVHDDNSKIGIILSKSQWISFINSLSVFESNFISGGKDTLPKQIFGFTVMIIDHQIVDESK